MINGINLNDPAQNQITFQPSINTVSEFKVDNSTFSAEYGRNSGAIVNIATRSGTNDFHGEVFEFFRDDSLDSRNYFNQPPAPQSPFKPQPVRRQPRRADREEQTFFFATYEGCASARASTSTAACCATISARRSPIRCRATCCR